MIGLLYTPSESQLCLLLGVLYTLSCIQYEVNRVIRLLSLAKGTVFFMHLVLVGLYGYTR